MAGKHSKSFFNTIRDIFMFKNINIIQRDKSVETLLSFKIVAIVLVASLIVSSVLVGGFFVSGSTQKSILDEAKKHFDNSGGNAAIEILSRSNSDIKGWLNINDTDISYAVCCGKDDKYYINHNQNGKKSRNGALFLSSSDSFERNGNDKNIVIFGNNMKDGTMFGSLKKYRNINFYKQHPSIELYFGETKENYVIFSIMLISSYENDTGDVYNPTKSHFVDSDDFELWYNECCERSFINTTVDAQYGDNMLTLVTAANDFDGARLVVMAKRVDEWDASHTDVSGATVNAKIKYPKIWYTMRGIDYPH